MNLLRLWSKSTPAISAPQQLRRGELFCLIFVSCIAAPAWAQSSDCDRIRAQIAAIDQGGGRRPNNYASAAQKQQAELERTSAYARSLGCDRGGFSFFGTSQTPPQCNGLNARIQSMQANLGQLQGMAGAAGGGGYARQDLVARYNAYCRSQPRGFFDSLFGNSGGSQTDIPLEAPPPPSDEEEHPHGGSQAICVRQCDGGFFPLNYSARGGNLDNLEDLCRALCPGTEVSLYTRNPDNDVGMAVGANGTPYRDLQNAFKFQKTFDAACTCKPKGVSWLQALTQSDAEHVLGQERRGDILVTPEKSLEMSRPKMDPLLRTKLLAADPNQALPLQAPSQPGSAAPQGATTATGTTSSNAPRSPALAPVPDDQAGTQDVVGPDGVKRRVRIIGPTP